MGRTFVYDWLAGTSAKRQSASGLITEQDYQNMQRQHKRRRMLESNAADLNTSGITMNDVMMRTYGHASKPEKKKCEWDAPNIRSTKPHLCCYIYEQSRVCLFVLSAKASAHSNKHDRARPALMGHHSRDESPDEQPQLEIDLSADVGRR